MPYGRRTLLAGFEEAAEQRAAERASAQLGELRSIDTTRLGAAQRIDWLLAQSWLSARCTTASCTPPGAFPPATSPSAISTGA